MIRELFNRAKGVFLALVLLLGMAGGTASAATYDLCAGQGTVLMPNGAGVSVWGFGLDTGGPCTPTIPGPTLRVDPADPVLTVNLRNELTEPVSLQILGQQLAVNNGPVWDNGAVGARTDVAARVRSFSHEADANGGTATYTWGTAVNPFKPGTWQILSGTDPAKQIQMGLSAPVIKDAAAGVAYADNLNIPGDQSVPYVHELILVFQEIDPDFHAAVAAGTYGTPGSITSSAHRDPGYFLINGMSYPNPGLDPLNAVTPVMTGEGALLRFINAGGETRVPQILNNYFKLVAEDGIPLRYAQERYGFELNSAKTMDAVLVPAAPGRFPILDGRLSLTNAGTSPGGMVAFLNVEGIPLIDTVTINSVLYDSLAQTLTVTATSTGQPGVTLTAVGFGDLAWGGADYGATFTNVTTRPDSVTVTSSGGGSATFILPAPDTVTIQGVTYDGGAQTLTVTATSSAQPGVTLSAAGFGDLAWGGADYSATFTNVTTRPDSVTVTSSGGGSATYTLPPDTVTIQSVTYDGGAQTLTVTATSSDQPGVSLTATGYGALAWNAAQGNYTATFTGVTTRPTDVTVTSSGGGSATYTLPPAGDTVTIVSVTYNVGSRTLEVIATSSDQPGVSLTAVGFGNLQWRSTENRYRTTFYSVASRPDSVTVTSSGGGSDTYTLPPTDTVTITGLVYFPALRRLQITVTSSDQPNVSIYAPGYGWVSWRSYLNAYRSTFNNVNTKPESVTVNSSGGGTATMAVP